MTGEPDTAAAPARDSRAWLAVCAAAVVGVAWFAYREVFALPHLGWDTWPMIATARVESWSDFVGTFTEKLMDGRYPLGDFYRPVTNLSVALDHALWGTDPLGYHATDFAILCGTALFAAVLCRRLFESRVAATLAALAFVLHPVHWESLPVTARRADTLSVLFVLAWLAALPLGQRADGRRPGLGRALLVFGLALAAVGTKETGALVAGLALVLVALAPARTARRRLVPSVVATLVAVGAFVAARTAVLGGLGGHGESSIANGFRNGPGLIDEYGGLVLMPQPWFDDPSANQRLALGAVVALALALALGFGARGDAERRSNAARGSGLAFLALWLGGLLVLTGISGELRSWYSIPFLPIWCGFVAGACAGASLLGHRRPSVAAVAWILALGAAVVPLRHCGLTTEYAAWGQIGAALDSFFARAEAAIGRTAPGRAVSLPAPPPALSTPLDRVGVRAASGIADYGVQAWADVRYASGAVRVHDARRGPARPGADEVLLVLTAPRPPRPR